MFLQIVKANRPEPWQYTDPQSGVTFDTVFHLQVLSDDDIAEIDKANTSREKINGMYQEKIDWEQVQRDRLCKAITGWDHLQIKGEDQPCTDELKLLLPEPIKLEILRLCIGKQLGGVVAKQAEDPQKGSGATSNGSTTTGASSPAAS